MKEEKREISGFTTTVSKNWSLTLYEVLGVIGTTVMVSVLVTIWCLTTFQTKSAAIEMKIELEKQISINTQHIQRVETNVARMDERIGRTAENVEYIRGRLEPKTNKE